MKTIKQIFAKSILGIAVIALFLFTASCSQESLTETNGDLNTIYAKSDNAKRVKKNISGKLFNFADADQTEANLVFCAPGFPLSRNIINGRMTHLGKLQPGSEYDETGDLPISGGGFGVPISGSYGIPISCTPGAADLSVAITEFIVYYVAANGDQFYTYEPVSIIFDFLPDGSVDFSNGSFTNTDGMPIEILGGTGRFAGATGELIFKDARFSFDAEGNGGSTWELEGHITY